MKRWLQLVIVAALSVLVLAACGGNDAANSNNATNNTGNNNEGNNNAGDGDTYVIGATQIVEQPSLVNAYQGLPGALAKCLINGVSCSQSAPGIQNYSKSTSNNLIAKKNDSNFANSTPSALGALNDTSG